MEQSDLLDSHSKLETAESVDLKGNSFILLILSIFLSRLAYYSFRGVLLLFCIQVYNFDRGDALYQFGIFTALIYLTSILGGLLGDFVFKAYPSLIIGSILASLGAALCALVSVEALYTGCTLVILGSALYKPNFSAHIARITGRNMKLLDKRYMIMYLAINIGAFCAFTFALLLARAYGYYLGFVIAGGAWLMSAALLFFTRNISSKPAKSETLDPSIRFGKPSYGNIAILLFPMIAATIYWVSIEEQVVYFVYDVFPTTGIFDVSSIQDFLLNNLNFLLIIPLGVASIFLFRKIALHPLQKMSIGLMLIAITWICMMFFLRTFAVNNFIAYFILIYFLHAVAELLIAPPLQSVIALHTPQKILGLVYGVSFALGAFLIKWTMAISDSYHPEVMTYTLIGICVVFSIGLFFLPYAFSNRKPKLIIDERDILDV
jgi:dipeptide/tripeptide permease